MDKYELTNQSKLMETSYGKSMVFQIKALVDIPDIGVKAGDLGGYIGTEECLGQANDCWVFKDSAVTRGSKVKNRAQIKGTSIITGNSVVRGNAIVIDSEILWTCVVQGSSEVKESDISEKCVISGKSKVKKSRLRSLNLVDGKIINSTVQSFGDEKLELGKGVDIEDCDIDIQAETPLVMRGIQMKNVKGYDFVDFRILEKTVMENLVFDGETSIAVGKVNSPTKNRTSLIGGEEGLVLDGVDLKMQNSSVIGEGLLKGKLELENSHVSDIVHIVNDMEESLHLLDCTVREFASLHKSALRGRTTFTNQHLSGDVVVNT